MVPCLAGPSYLAEEILCLIAKKNEIKINDIQNRFGVTKQTANSVIDFLMKFGFIELDNSKRYINLSNLADNCLQR